MPDRIDSFTGEYSFLSNFYVSPFVHGGINYLTVEHAFQAAKTTDPDEQIRVASATTPGEAKKLGRKVKLRSDWESVKFRIMEDLLRIKFTSDHYLALQLIATGNQELVEGNSWGDRVWGTVNGKGQNHLGKLLMKIRSELGSGF